VIETQAHRIMFRPFMRKRNWVFILAVVAVRYEISN